MADGDERGPKFRRRAEARPDEVLDAALELFVEKGFAHTRVEDIAARAGLSKGAVYLYFPSKEAILEGLVKRVIRNDIEEGYCREVDPELTLRSIVGPIVLHLLIAEIFGIMPAGGLSIERLIDSH